MLSIVVVVHNMPEQAQKTLHSLSSAYQRGVRADDYEVIIVENRSDNNLDSETLQSLPSNFSYHLRAESEPTPVHAVNFGGSVANGSHICVMVDGARMVTPGLVAGIIKGHKLEPDTVVSVPGYHLGRQLQQNSVELGYGFEEEAALLKRIAWPESGYRLFDIACFSGSCTAGIFRPNSESNCISVPRRIWDRLGGFDRRFTLPGGGLLNLDFYRRACEASGVQHVVLMGEGTFHQFHGGVTTGGIDRLKREVLLDQFEAQYAALRGETYQCPQTEPIYLGRLSPEVERFIRLSVNTPSIDDKSGQAVDITSLKAVDS